MASREFQADLINSDGEIYASTEVQSSSYSEALAAASRYFLAGGLLSKKQVDKDLVVYTT